MTYIHPDHHNNIMNRILAGLIFTAFASVFCLVALYNNVVNLNHNIVAAKMQLDSIGVQNTAIHNRAAAALENVQSGSSNTQSGLVQDNHPQYFSISRINSPSSQLSPLSRTEPWPIASQR